MTPDRDQRAIRFLSAAAADLTAGGSISARANLALALPDLHDPVLVAAGLVLDATIAFIDSIPGPRPRGDAPGHVGEIVSMMLDAARTLEPLDLRLARYVLLETFPMAIYFGDSSAVSATDVARVVLLFKLPPGSKPTSADLVSTDR